mmetsp:Transcript_75223/g.156703  ORF Transcript_75223/g.156703 Transcript_75223/m.156703 type:complete len:111 (+) Transcript_75223:294-626(+)
MEDSAAQKWLTSNNQYRSKQQVVEPVTIGREASGTLAGANRDAMMSARPNLLYNQCNVNWAEQSPELLHNFRALGHPGHPVEDAQKDEARQLCHGFPVWGGTTPCMMWDG